MTGGGSASLSNDLTVVISEMKAFITALVHGGHAPTMLEGKVAKLKEFVRVNDLKAFPGLSITRNPGVRFKGAK